MNAPSYAQPHGNLLFHWERPRQRGGVIAGFFLASVVLHGLCFYIFQVVYPPTIALLPPPAQVSVIAPTTPEARNFLNWLNAEDPALASKTQRPADARAFQLPKSAHVPSYLASAPQLKELPWQPSAPAVPSAMPPGPVPIAPPANSSPALNAPTSLLFSDGLRDGVVEHPALKFQSSSAETPESARFRVAVDSLGIVRYVFLEQSSGDALLDEQARRALALCRFHPGPGLTKSDELTWAIATFEFGSDWPKPPASTERRP